jgi:hypothetical protein
LALWVRVIGIRCGVRIGLAHGVGERRVRVALRIIDRGPVFRLERPIGGFLLVVGPLMRSLGLLVPA